MMYSPVLPAKPPVRASPQNVQSWILERDPSGAVSVTGTVKRSLNVRPDFTGLLLDHAIRFVDMFGHRLQVLVVDDQHLRLSAAHQTHVVELVDGLVDLPDGLVDDLLLNAFGRLHIMIETARYLRS